MNSITREGRAAALALAVALGAAFAVGIGHAAAADEERTETEPAATATDAEAAPDPAASRRAEPAAPPERALCRTCQLHGAGHGEEKVVAVRAYEGTSYYFCAEKCAETFDGFPAAYAYPVLPRPAPAVTVTTLDGTRIDLAAPAGRVVLVDFWATWCAPCVKAMPKLQALHEEHAADGLLVVGVSIDSGEQNIRKFVEKKKVTYPIARDGGEIPTWEQFRVAAVPAVFLIDGSGNIVAQWTGQAEPDEVRAEVLRLLLATES